MITNYTDGYQVRCKICGTIIVDWVDAGETKDAQERIVVRQQHRPLPSYRTVVLECEDGSKHETPLCANCLNQPLDTTTMNELYQIDVAQWQREGVDVKDLKKRKMKKMIGVRRH